jgi:hypothetical protein
MVQGMASAIFPTEKIIRASASVIAAEEKIIEANGFSI